MMKKPEIRTLMIAMVTMISVFSTALGQGVTYTLDADFDLGTLLNVNHDTPNNDQLQLNATTEPFPFVNIAVSNRGTVARIDANTGAVLGEYSTNPDAGASSFPNPSRTTVDQFGNVWVGNRSENTSVGGVPHGSVTRIGLILGGTRVDSDGTPNPVGQYLAPPYDYNTCFDRDGDGLIKTSLGLGNILPWPNGGGADTFGGVSTAEDECIINYVLTPGTGTRTVAVDAQNDVWVGNIFGGTGTDFNHVEINVSGVTATLNAASLFNVGYAGYGGFIDGSQVLWSAGRNFGLLRHDLGTMVSQQLLNRGDYGLGLDPNTGTVWQSTLFGPSIYELNPDGTIRQTLPQPRAAQGVAVDGNSHVWVAELFGDEVLHYAPDPGNPSVHILVGIVSGFAGTTGLSVDSNGKIWASENSSSATRGAARIDPTAGPLGAGGIPIGAIDLTVGLGAGGNPYNYSDMTGFQLLSAIQQGTWTVVYDTGADDTEGCIISWNDEPEGAEPAGTSITVEARASNFEGDLPAETYVAVTNGVDAGLSGGFIEIRTTLARDPGVTDTPVLSDLTIQCNEAPDCSNAVASIEEIWPPNHKFVEINILGVTDPDSDPVTITINSIFQDEPLDTFGDGSFEPDGFGVGTDTASVRAERSGTKKVPGDGRVYHIGFTADDGNGGICNGVVQVCVPHDQRKGHECIDGGPLFDSTGGVGGDDDDDDDGGGGD